MRRVIVIAAVSTAFLVGCGEESAPAGAPAPPPRSSRKNAAATDAAPQGPGIIYAYNPVGKRDPFRGATMVAEARPTEASTGPACTDLLCNFELSELTVVAVVSGDANPLAMVEDGAGLGYLVRRNSKIGRQGGKVTQILRDCIIVTSFVSGPDGKVQPVKVEKCVRAETEGAPVLDLLGGKNIQ
jgi:type IV pilus assembly protein PilP